MLPVNKSKIRKQTKKSSRRTDVKLVLLNEEELIRQVCVRPVIYDRSLKGYRKMSLRKQCWSDISKIMESTEEECRKRWRSLRDSFSKHYKVAQTLADTDANKPCKWVFYEQMSFLIPHLDGVSYDFNKILDEFGDFSEDAQSLDNEPIAVNTANVEVEQNQHPVDNIKNIEAHGQVNNASSHNTATVSAQPADFEPISIINTHRSSLHNNENNISTSSIPFSGHNHCCGNHSNSVNNGICREAHLFNGSLDSDDKFLLSCSPILRRLTNRQNALARLKIQQILYDIEFDQKNF